MKKNKVIKTLLALTVAASMVCGCGANGESVTEVNSTVTENSEETVQEATTKEAVEIKVETTQDTAKDDAVKEEATTEDTTEESVDEIIPLSEKEMKDITAMDVVNDMKIGWNLGNTLDATHGGFPKDSDPKRWETCWGNPVTTKELMEAVTAKGFNVIRIPVSWGNHILDDGKYTIVESWMDRVQEVVDYAYNIEGTYIILNAHHEDWYYPYYDNEEKGSAMLKAVWTQIADRFQDYDEHLIFEGMNEPRKVGTDLEWNGGDKEGWDMVNKFNKVFVDTIRSSSGNNPDRILSITGYAADCNKAYKFIEVPENDNKIIVNIHSYSPYDFALNKNGTAVWNNRTQEINELLNNINIKYTMQGIPVTIDEFGAMAKPDAANEAERAAWASYFVTRAKRYGVKCVWWDNGAFTGDGELFGIIDRKTYKWRYESIVDAMMAALEQE